MTMGFPLGLLALTALVPLVGAYFLRRRQPPKTVSAVFLWRSFDVRAEAGPRLERFSREFSLVLETLAVLCAAVFLSDLHCGKSIERRHVVVVVDGSMSMSATWEGTSVADRARRAIAKLAVEESASVMTIVESGVQPTVLAGPEAETAKALAALESWAPVQPAHDLAPAVARARDIVGGRDSRIYLMTDGPVPDTTALAESVEVHSFGHSADNIAFVSVSRKDDRGVALVTVRVSNFSSAKKRVPLRFESVGDVRSPAAASESEKVSETSVVDLEVGATAVVRVSLHTVRPIEVTAPADALDLDSRVVLAPAPLPDVGLGFLEGLDPSAVVELKRFASIAPQVRLNQAAPTLTFGPPGSTARVQLGAGDPRHSFVGPFFGARHPVLDDVHLGGVVWTAGPNPPGAPLLTAGSTVLMSVEAQGVWHLNLELARSNVHRTAAWPILMGNLVRAARAELAGFPRKQVLLGEDVPVVTAGDARWVLKGPNGQERSIVTQGALSLSPVTVNAPGRWILERNGAPFDALEALALDAAESDLRQRTSFDRTAAPVTHAHVKASQPVAWWAVLLMLGLLLIDYRLTARKRA